MQPCFFVEKQITAEAPWGRWGGDLMFRGWGCGPAAPSPSGPPLFTLSPAQNLVPLGCAIVLF